MKFLKKQSGYFLFINIVFLALEPIFIMLVLFLKIAGINALPWWARGIVLSWAMTINLWVGIGSLFDSPWSGLTSLKFFITNFFLPVLIAVFYINSFWLSLYQITSYHFLALGIGSGLVMLLGPFIETDNPENMKFFSLKKFKNKKELLAAIGWLFFGFSIFASFITLPAIGCEMIFLEKISSTGILNNPSMFIRNYYWLILRYVGIGYESFFLFKLMLDNSIYG